MRRFAHQGRLAYAASGMPEYKRYLDEMPGVPLQNAWHDIPPAVGGESLGYPTQKPLALLERIIAASSNEDDVVLDPFCGCGTAILAAQKLRRQWIGIDVTHLAISLIERRMKDAFPDAEFTVEGTPKDSIPHDSPPRQIPVPLWGAVDVLRGPLDAEERRRGARRSSTSSPTESAPKRPWSRSRADRMSESR